MFIFLWILLKVAVNWHEVDGSKLNIIDATLTMFRDMVLIRLLYMLKIWKVKGEDESRKER